MSPSELSHSFQRSTSTNTHVPSPYWFKIVPLKIPTSSCDRAAEIITSLLEPEALAKVLGGRTWWTVRAMEGVDAEWIAMKADVRGVPYSEIEKPKKEAAKDPFQGRYIQGMDRLQRVMVRLD